LMRKILKNGILKMGVVRLEMTYWFFCNAIIFHYFAHPKN
jgi:hypothetical protein